MLWIVTERPGEVYDEFLGRIMPKSIARRVKIADIVDNLNILRLGGEMTDNDGVRLRKYQQAYVQLRAHGVC